MIGALILMATLLALLVGVGLALRTREQLRPEIVLHDRIGVRYVRGPIVGSPSLPWDPPYRYKHEELEAAVGCAAKVLGAIYEPALVDRLLDFSLEIRAPEDPAMLEPLRFGWTDFYRPTAFSGIRPRVTIRMLYTDRMDTSPLSAETASRLRHPAKTALFHEIGEHIVPFVLRGDLNRDHKLPMRYMSAALEEQWNRERESVRGGA